MKTILTSISKVWFIVPGLLLLLVTTLPTPPAGAEPAYGITPTPTGATGQPTATPNPGGATATPTSPSGGHQDVATLDVQFGCDNICPLDGQAFVVSGRVQLIHRGSGWIAEGVISNQAGTQFQVPYPGEYEVYLIEPLIGELAAAGPLPLFLGVVETNSGLQLTDCPANCLGLLEPTPLPPLVLPETGTPSHWPQHNQTFFLIAGLLIVGVTCFSLARRHRRRML